MAGNTNKTVHDIFQSMEYGPAATSSYATAQAWLERCSRSLGLFIGGKIIRPADRQTSALMDNKGGQLCSTLCATQADVDLCASSALDGFKAWSSLPCHQRARALLKLAGVVGQHGPCLSELCELSEASCSASSLVRLLQFYSGWAQLRDTSIPDWTPLGVIAVVVSADCSFYSLMLKVLPALAMGNSVIVVPGRSTAPPALLFAQLAAGAGLPSGTLNILTGSDIKLGANVAKNPSISFVAYSGNKQDGVALCKATAGMGVPVSVSPTLGATCPFIIFESADIQSAVDGAIEAAFAKKKEVQWVLCVQESVLDSVVTRLRLRMAGMKCTTLPGEGDRASVVTAVQEAQQQGATLIQSCAAPASGRQYPPTVLCGAAPSSPCVVTPSPGPLLPLMTFRTYAEAVALGNHSPHGQAASIWTEELALALETARSLSVGTVWVNSHSVLDPCMPVSGHKDSGTCTDGGQEGLYQFLRPSSSAPPLRSSPVSMDCTKFGTAAPPPVVPDDAGSSPKSYLQFIGGKACKSESGGSVTIRSPCGADVLAFCPDGGHKDVRNAVEAAIKVQPGWMKKSPSARAQSLHSLAKCLEAKRREVAASIGVQCGLSSEDADVEVELAVVRLGEWAAYCGKIHGGSLPVPQSGCGLSLPEPLGVVGAVLPDKNPLLSMVTILGAAIATGNAIVMAPSEKHPLPALAFIQVLQASDLPAGLVSVVTGDRDKLTAALAAHSVIKAIWYWGSAEGCQYLQLSCTRPLKTLRLSHQRDEEGPTGGLDWTGASVLEDMWRGAVQWKSVWIPTA